MRRRKDDAKQAPAPLSDALASFLARTALGEGIARASVIQDWPQFVGETISAVTRPEAVTPDGILRVRVATAAWANELSLMTPTIIARLNAARAGKIRGIRWIAGGTRA